MSTVYLNIFFAIAVAITVFGDVVSKSWAVGGRALLFPAALIIYTFANIIWLFMLKYVNLSVAAPWWVGISLLFSIMAGIFYFHERLAPLEIAAVLLIFSGIFILSLERAL